MAKPLLTDRRGPALRPAEPRPTPWPIWGLSFAAAAVLLVAPLPVAAAAAIGLGLLAARDPLPTLCLVVISLPFYLLPRSVGHYEFSPTEILIVIATVAAVARLLVAASRTGGEDALTRPAGRPLPRGEAQTSPPAREKHLNNPLSPWERVRVRASQFAEPAVLSNPFGDRGLLVLALLFLVAGIVSLTASVELHPSLQSLRTIVVEPIVFYLLVVSQVRDRRGAFALGLALVVAGVLISGIGLWQDLTNERIITAEAGLRRIRGFYGSPNNLGLFLGRALPMSVALALWLPRGRVLWVAASLLMALGLILTFSIGAWAAVPVALLLVALLRGRRAFIIGLGFGLLGLVGSVLVALAIPRIGSHLDLSQGTSAIRLDVWQSGLQMLADHPIRGIGLDNFLHYYQNGYRQPTAWQDPNLSHPHNLVLDFWLSLGLAGPILLGCLLGRFAELVVRRWRRAGALERALSAGSAGALADMVGHGLVDNSFFLPDLAVLFWLMFAIVAVLQRAGADASAR
jgi:O-antigen ligase